MSDGGQSSGGLLRPDRVVEVSKTRYRIDKFIDSGGSGELYRVERVDSAGEMFALKLYLPPWNLLQAAGSQTETAWAQISTAIKLQTKEYDSLHKASHPNIVRVFAQGLLTLSKSDQRAVGGTADAEPVTQLPALVSEYIDGLPLDRALRDGELDGSDLPGVLAGVASALDYIHTDRKYLHADVRASNVVVRRASNSPVLVDFAAGKNFNFDEVGRTEQTALYIDPAMAPLNIPPLADFFRSARAAVLTREELVDKCFPTLDLYQFGLMLKTLRPLVQGSFDTRELEYYDCLTNELSDWGRASEWKGDLTPRIRRMGSHHFYPFGVKELAESSGSTKTIRLPDSQTVPLNGFAVEVVANRSFRRLTTINQLSLIHFVYPAADYKRFVHALQTYEIARQLVAHLYATPRFRFLFDEESARQLLAVALLHDINHFPFLHIVQEARIHGLDNASVVREFCSGEATGENARGEPSVFDILGKLGIDPERFLRLTYGKHHDQTSEVDQVINSVISSGADIDKMAYLYHDAFFTGLPYGRGIDMKSLLASATLVETPNGRTHLGYQDRALEAVENVFMTRFWHFRSIYWHHTNRAVMAMILHVVRRLFEEKGRNINEYISATKWIGDAEALRWLDRTYMDSFGRPSILADLSESRAGIYRKLYTVRPAGDRGLDDILYADISELAGADKGSYAAELDLRKAISAGLSDRFAVKVETHEVLLDVPRRGGLNDPGDAYLLTDRGVRPLTAVSAPIAALGVNYQQLTQRVRVFVAPAVASSIGRERTGLQRREIGALIAESVKQTKSAHRGSGGVS